VKQARPIVAPSGLGSEQVHPGRPVLVISKTRLLSKLSHSFGGKNFNSLSDDGAIELSNEGNTSSTLDFPFFLQLCENTFTSRFFQE
jgi:hypothetical protein